MIEIKLQKVTVLKEFRDKDNFTKVYKADSEAAFPVDRAKYLKALGLVDFKEVKKDDGNDNPPVETIDLGKHWMQIVSDVKRCVNVEELEKALTAETSEVDPKGQNRNSVIDALNARIDELKAE